MDHDDDYYYRSLWVTFPSTFLAMCTLAEEERVRLVANVVVVRNRGVALDNLVVGVVNSGIHHLFHALILTFALLMMTNLYILHVATMVDPHSFDPEITPLMVVVVVPLHNDLAEADHVLREVIRLANGVVVVVDRASRNAAAEVLHNIHLVGRVMEVDQWVEHRLRNAALVVEVVEDIAGIDQRVAEVSTVIQRRMFRRRLVLIAYLFSLPEQEM
jgi:hypothetical protein